MQFGRNVFRRVQFRRLMQKSRFGGPVSALTLSASVTFGAYVKYDDSAERVRLCGFGAVQFRRIAKASSFGGSVSADCKSEQFRPCSFGAMLERAVSADQVFYRNKLKKDYYFKGLKNTIF